MYSYKNIYIVFNNFHELYLDGFTVYKCFELLYEVAISKKYKKSILQIKQNILNGISIGEAIKKTKLYPDFFCEIIQKSEERGSLDISLDSLARYCHRKNILISKIRNAMIYPFTILILFLIVSIVAIFFIFPLLMECFMDINTNISEFAVNLFNFVVLIKSISAERKIAVILIISVVNILLICILFKFKIIQNIFFSTSFGKLITEYKFMLLLQMIMYSGGNITEILKMEINYKSLGIKKKQIESFTYGISKGKQISSIICDYNFISKYTISMIKLGEARGKIDLALNKIVAKLEKNMNDKLLMFTKSIQPVSIIFVTAFIIIFIIIFVAPMMDVLNIGV